jgi:hypothetical protein
VNRETGSPFETTV